ncbi:MAG TPA: tetratricopeptide repeat protein [Bryobacteraceae bacterium]|nr:tetratricopeptide repeat protein [Bryobacteraceae bacterium]
MTSWVLIGVALSAAAGDMVTNDAWGRLFDEAYRLEAEGRYAEAFVQSSRALEETQKFDPGDVRISMTLNRIGIAATHLGRYPVAEKAFLRGIRLIEQRQGDRFPLALLLGNLGSVYFLEGNRNKEAEQLKRRALDLALSVVGPNHPDTGNLFLGLAILELQTHRMPEAQAHLESALAALENSPPEYATHLAAAFHNFAHLAASRERYSEAIAKYEKSIALFEQNLRPDHPSLTYPLTGLASVYIKTDQAALALPLLDRALRIAESAYDKDHPVLANVLSLYAAALKKAGRKTEAQVMASRAATIAAVRRAKVDISDLGAGR